MSRGSNRLARIGWSLLLPTLVGTASLSAQTTVTAGVNVRFVAGSFGSDQTTSLLYAPAVIRVETSRFEMSALFPYLTIHNGTVALSQGGFVPMRGTLSDAPNTGMPMAAAGTTSMMMGSGMMGRTGAPPIAPGQSPAAALVTNQAGAGDIVATAGYRVVDKAPAGLQIVMSGRVKVPTASASAGLGTGRFDTGASAAVRKQFARGWCFAEAGYLFIGEPEGVDLRNVALWNVGGARFLTERVGLLFSASGNTALLRDFAAPVELGAGVALRSRRTTFSLIPTVGLSDASPRYAINVGIGVPLFRR